MPNRKNTANKDTLIAFIGLGNMGAPMATNLVRAGYNVTVFDLSEQAKQRLTKVGAHTASSPFKAAENADVVITMLPAGEHVKNVYLGHSEATELTSNGLLSILPAGTLIIDCSTIAAADAKLVAKIASNKGIDIIDAPVSGSTAGAEAGVLTFIVGGEDAAVTRAKPILQIMGSNILHAGTQGAGQVAKLCNNMLLGIVMAGTAEAINLGVKNGLDADVLSEIMMQSSGRNWALEVYNPYPNINANVPSSHGYEGGFMSQHMHKDLYIALEAAQSTGIETPMGTEAAELYDEHVKQHSEKDFSSIMAYYEPSVLNKG